jgi:hypothetical protein
MRRCSPDSQIWSKSFFGGAGIFIWLPIRLSAIRHLPAGTATTAAVAWCSNGFLVQMFIQKTAPAYRLYPFRETGLPYAWQAGLNLQEN